MRLITSHIKTLAIKDFTWKTERCKPEPVTIPLGEGMIDSDLFFNYSERTKYKSSVDTVC
jgi:hypothetical protein